MYKLQYDVIERDREFLPDHGDQRGLGNTKIVTIFRIFFLTSSMTDSVHIHINV